MAEAGETPTDTAYAVHGDTNVNGNEIGRLVCPDAVTGKELWRIPNLAAQYVTPAYHDGVLYAADDAVHLRDGDYVVGLVHKGQARAYPLWITDNYHMINDRVGGDPVVFCTCKRCQSGSAFVSALDGVPVTFSALGMYNASLTMCNRRARGGEPHSLWLHYEGVAIDGPRKGAFLDQIPTFHMLWRDWVALHPDTDVMLPPDDPHHRDARHGHGREEIFSRPGMDMPLARTITGHLDRRYAENEVVLGVNIDAGIRAWPMLEVKREGGVVNDRLGDAPVVVFCGPRPEQIAMAAYARAVDGRALSFRREADGFRDAETGSLWSIEGRAVDGSCRGRALPPLRWQYVRWRAWVYPHPSTELFVSSRPLPAYPDLPALPQVRALDPVLRALAGLGRGDVRLSHVIVTPRLPHEAVDGLCEDEAGAERVMGEVTHAFREGRWVLRSIPVLTYAEPHYEMGMLPDDRIAWSPLLKSRPFRETVAAYANDWQRPDCLFR